ncbi:MAG: hypothetical protein ABIA76_05460, partial [Candidatus Diapherotrites archaeon]
EIENQELNADSGTGNLELNANKNSKLKPDSEIENSFFKSNEFNPKELTEAMFAEAERTRFQPGEERTLMDIDLVNSGLENEEYAVLGVMDYSEGNNPERNKTSFFHSKFIGSTSQCMKFTGSEEISGETSLANAFRVSDNYEFTSGSNAMSRCSSVYCDGAQFLEKLALNMQAISDSMDEGATLNSDELNNYLSFSAKLKREGYGEDLVNDFREYFINSYLEASLAFKDKFSKLFDSEIIEFRLLDSETMQVIYETSDSEPFIVLDGPGTYWIELQFEFSGNEETLFTGSDEVNVEKIIVSMRKISDPVTDSAMYYLPFDHGLGSDGTREGYGVITVGDEEGFFNVPEVNDALVYLNVEKEEEFYSLNSGKERASVLRIERTGENDFDAKISITHPNPVLMVINDTAKNAFYTLKQGSSKLNPAAGFSSLGKWTGIGVSPSLVDPVTGLCYGFENNFLPRAFSDRTANAWDSEGFKINVDSSVNLSNIHGLSFEKDSEENTEFHSGTIALYSLIYTSINPVYPEIELSTASNAGNAFSDKDNRMFFNLNYSPQAGGLLKLNELLGLVEDQKLACIYSDKDEVDVFWNEEKIAIDSFEEKIRNSGLYYCSPTTTFNYNDYADWGNGSE